MRLHRNSPEKLFRETGRFFFTPGQLTPSLFNDDSMLPILTERGVSPEDAENYAVAGCQEPLVMGKDNGNTTNSWLNLAKVLEVTLNEGRSSITGRKLAASPGELASADEPSARDLLFRIREFYYKQLDKTMDAMCAAADDCSRALSHLRVPFLSCAMGGIESAVDLRNDKRQGTPYNGSGLSDPRALRPGRLLPCPLGFCGQQIGRGVPHPAPGLERGFQRRRFPAPVPAGERQVR